MPISDSEINKVLSLIRNAVTIFVVGPDSVHIRRCPGADRRIGSERRQLFVLRIDLVSRRRIACPSNHDDSASLLIVMRWPARRAIRHAPLTILCPERIAAWRQASHRSLVRLIAEHAAACMIDQRTAAVGVVVIMVQMMLPFADRHAVASRHRIAVVGTVFVGVLAAVLFFHSVFFRQRQ